MDVRGRLDVDRDAVGSGADEVGDLAFRPIDHQVHVDHRTGGVDAVGQGRNHVRAERDRRDEVAVHDVDVDDAGASRQYLVDLAAEPAEICREDRGCDVVGADLVVQSCLSMLPWQ
jgi:hypothetical protein